MQSFKAVKLQLLQAKSDLSEVLEELNSVDTDSAIDASRNVSDALDSVDVALEVLQ
jgi:hypothetical protein